MPTRDMAFMADPTAHLLTLNGILFDCPAQQLVAAFPDTFFIAADDENVEDFCLKVPLSEPAPTAVFVIGGIEQQMQALDFIGGRPPTRPPAK